MKKAFFLLYMMLYKYLRVSTGMMKYHDKKHLVVG